MYKIFFRNLLIVTCLGVSFSAVAVAVDYTARHSKQKRELAQKKELAQKDGKDQCSDKDMRAIKKSNRKAKNEIDSWYELVEASRRLELSTEEVNVDKLIKQVRENFFISEQYISMQAVYKRCNQEFPITPLPFWLPKSFYGTLGATVTPL
ncbi:MAG: hypothetical protein COB36_06355 [Alphaproteobacteria bacterium]|nr:MAG: hypothetical protein COB36_06355 [Alphaproteobacteria bacterium]